MTPILAFVPGFWEGTEPFDHVRSLLSEEFHTVICPLLSTGTTSPGNPTMADDIAAIRSSIESLITQEKEVVMVLHSAGGFLGSEAIEKLSAKARNSNGLKGGVVGIVFLTGAVFPEGFEHGDIPFGEIKVRISWYWNSRSTPRLAELIRMEHYSALTPRTLSSMTSIQSLRTSGWGNWKPSQLRDGMGQWHTADGKRSRASISFAKATGLYLRQCKFNSLSALVARSNIVVQDIWHNWSCRKRLRKSLLQLSHYFERVSASTAELFICAPYFELAVSALYCVTRALMVWHVHHVQICKARMVWQFTSTCGQEGT